MTAVQYDELGFPSIPESWVMLWEADVQSVHDLRDGRLTLKPRAQPLLLRNGAVGRFVSGALVRSHCRYARVWSGASVCQHQNSMQCTGPSKLSATWLRAKLCLAGAVTTRRATSMSAS